MTGFFQQMNWLDGLLLFIMAASLLTSLFRGFTREVAGMAALVLAVLLALWFHADVGAFFESYVGTRELANLFGFGAIFFGVIIAGNVVGYIIAKMVSIAGLSLFDRLMGGALGLAKGALIASVVLFAMLAFSPTGPPESVKTSVLAPYVTWSADALSALAPAQLRDVVEKNAVALREWWMTTPLPSLPQGTTPSPAAKPKEDHPTPRNGKPSPGSAAARQSYRGWEQTTRTTGA